MLTKEQREAEKRHSTIDWLLRNFRHNNRSVSVVSMGDACQLDNEKSVTLECRVANCHVITCSFTPIVGNTALIAVRGFNWRCENEPSGAYSILKARELYRAMVKAGATKLEKVA